MKAAADEVKELDQAALAFERRARQLLCESVERLPAATRSRLTRARYAALGSGASWRRRLAWRWLPAGVGALATVVLVVLLTLVPRGESPAVSPLVIASPEDLELLADSDAVQLSRDQDLDYEFYEWAAGEATGAGASAVGT